MKKVQGSRLKVQGVTATRSKDSILAPCPLPLESSCTRILGIDPGLCITGFGVLDKAGQQLHYVASGCIKTPDGELPDRLKAILNSLGEVIAQHQPQQVAVEKVFVNVNPQSTLSLGQARGAAICAAVLANLPVSEYTALQVKQAVVGNGHAEKGAGATDGATLVEIVRHAQPGCCRRAGLRNLPCAWRQGLGALATRAWGCSRTE